MTVMAPVSPPGEPQPFPLRIEDYELLDRAGVFRDKRVELIGGRLIAVNAQLRPHVLVKNRLGRRLQEALETSGIDLEAFVEATLAIPPNDLPEPDILIGPGTLQRDYFRVPDVALLVEVADTSLGQDLGEKRDLYAEAGIPEYWVIDINAGEVHRFWRPHDGAYMAEPPIALAGALSSLTMSDLVVDGTGIL